jgi:RNA polymerase sigma-70 factor (ECF subfamily)
VLHIVPRPIPLHLIQTGHADMNAAICQACQQLGVGNEVESVLRRIASLEWLRIPARLTSLSDEALLIHVRDGCIDAMGLLFDRHYPVVSTIAFKILRDPNEAQVVVEEVFYEIFLKSREFDSNKAAVKEWFSRSSYVRSMNRRRLNTIGRVDAETAEILFLSTEPVTDFGRKLAALSPREHKRVFRRARKRLSERQRRVLELSVFDFLTSEEIAVRIEASREEVRTLLCEALLILRDACRDAVK